MDSLNNKRSQLFTTWGQNTQQNSYSISHLLGSVTTQCLDGDSVVTVVK